MNNNRNNLNLGDQILKAVDDILDSGNFDKLNSVVSDTVYKALDEVNKQLGKVTAGGNSASGPKTENHARATSGTNTGNSGSYRPVPAPKAKLQRVGSVSGVLFQVFGGIGTGIFGILAVIFLLSMAAGPGFAVLALGMGALAGICIAMIFHGVEKRARLKRAERYVQVMQGKSYINLADLALLTNKSERCVRKDIKKMIRMEIFPEGHLDQREKCLMLNDTAYREYMRLQKRREALALEEKEQKRLEQKKQWMGRKEAVENTSQEQEKAVIPVENTDNAELNAMIQEGNKCILRLRNLNDAIEGEVISRKLFQLEKLLKEIFEQLKEHPEQMPEMHKFMDYYLPTTLKLVTAYEEFDRVSVPGEDILSAKAEIEKTLDTINMAFAELLNKLFRDRAFDAATDAQVLKTMLAREGLTKEPVFVKKNTTDELK